MTIKRQRRRTPAEPGGCPRDTVYLAGMVASDPSADAKGQTQQILKKIETRRSRRSAATSPSSLRHRIRRQHGRLRRHERRLDAWIDAANTPHGHRRGAARVAEISGRDHVRRGHLTYMEASTGPPRPPKRGTRKGDHHERSRHRRQLADALAKSFRGSFNLTRPDDFTAHCIKDVLARLRSSTPRSRGRDHGLRPAARLAGP